MRVHWFNPENDLALACGAERYTPPAAPTRLRLAGEALPLWYADPGDRMLCHGVNDSWLRRVCDDFGLSPDSLWDHRPDPGLRPDPWGWSAWTRRTLLDEGLPAETMPTPDDIERMRRLSHRRTAGAVLRSIALSGPEGAADLFMPPAREISDPEWLPESEALVLKQPWSSSGRGVVDLRRTSVAKARGIIADSIRRQGCVMVETAVDKALDFALIYRCEGGRCTPVATSVFTTDASGAYRGNLLAPEAARRAAVTALCPEDCVALAEEALRQALEKTVAPGYDGIVGADLMVCRGAPASLALCEINLRHTMGYVAARLADRYLYPDSRGEMLVLPGPSTDLPDPPDVQAGRLRRGTLHLTPPSTYFRFLAKAE